LQASIKNKNLATGINKTSETAGVVDTGGKIASDVLDTGGKFAGGVVDTGGKFAGGVVDTGGAPLIANMSANF
jgi:hypothetical protein